MAWELPQAYGYDSIYRSMAMRAISAGRVVQAYPQVSYALQSFVARAQHGEYWLQMIGLTYGNAAILVLEGRSAQFTACARQRY